MAQAWSRRGARLLLSSRREEELQDVRNDCVHPERHRVLPLDLAAPESLQAAVEEARAAYPTIDVLINNAGISQRGTARSTEMAVVRRIMEVNFFGTVALTKALLPHFIKQGHGHIGVISSIVGTFSTPHRTAYAASKHALHGYFDGLRAEVHDQGVRVTLICPGYVQTNVTRNALTADGSAYGTMSDSIRNGMNPDDCATAIIQALHEARDEVYIGGVETYMVYLKRFLPPALFNRLIRLVDTT